MNSKPTDKTAKPGRNKRGGNKAKDRVAEIAREDFEKAKGDEKVLAFFKQAREEGKQLEREGLIHR